MPNLFRDPFSCLKGQARFSKTWPISLLHKRAVYIPISKKHRFVYLNASQLQSQFKAMRHTLLAPAFNFKVISCFVITVAGSSEVDNEHKSTAPKKS